MGVIIELPAILILFASWREFVPRALFPSWHEFFPVGANIYPSWREFVIRASAISWLEFLSVPEKSGFRKRKKRHNNR